MLNMNDDYAEFSVESKKRSAGIGMFILAILLAIIGFYLVLLINSMLPRNLIMIGSILIGLYICGGIPLLWSLCRKKDVEYDYLYIENDLEIDAVYNKSKRKHVITVHMEHAKRIAPYGSQALLGYEGKGAVTVKDFTSALEDIVPYVILLEKDGRTIEVMIEPNQHMLDLMKQRNKSIFYTE